MDPPTGFMFRTHRKLFGNQFHSLMRARHHADDVQIVMAIVVRRSMADNPKHRGTIEWITHTSRRQRRGLERGRLP